MAGRLPPFYKRLRFATAAVSTVLLNLGAFGVTLKTVCSPGFNCHGCPWATFACPVGAMAFGSAIRAIPVFAIASLLAVGVLLGRLACSFLCPFGFLQDLLYRLPGPKIKLPRVSRYGKYLALGLLVVALPWFFGFSYSGFITYGKPTVNKAEGGQLSVVVALKNFTTEPVKDPKLFVVFRSHETKEEVFREEKSFPEVTVPAGETMELPTFMVPNELATADLAIEFPPPVMEQKNPYELYYCRLCPVGTLTASIPSYFTGTQTFGAWLSRNGLRVGILVGFLVLMVISARPFCRLFCPMGAVYALTAPVALSRLEIKSEACTGCSACDKACPVDLDVRKEISGTECIACGDCKKACPQAGIERKFGL